MRVRTFLAMLLVVVAGLTLAAAFRPSAARARAAVQVPGVHLPAEVGALEARLFGQTGLFAPTPTPAADRPSYDITWKEGSNMTVVEWWNAPGRAFCDYANHPWPAQQLAAERAYVLGARAILRDVLKMGDWVAANRAPGDEVRIHGAETNCPIENGQPHLDYPPHIHIFYLARDAKGNWRDINSHHYPDAAGKIQEDFIIPSLCVQDTSHDVPADQWVDMLDEQCTTAWQQRFTKAGDLEIRRSPSDPTYGVRILPLDPSTPDLAGVDVLNASTGQVLYTIQITVYDPIAYQWEATIADHQSGTTVLEKWWGDPAAGKNLIGHTVTQLDGSQSSPSDPATPDALP